MKIITQEGREKIEEFDRVHGHQIHIERAGEFPSFISRLFGERDAKIVDVKIVQDRRGTYRIKLLEDRCGLFLKWNRVARWIWLETCFPGGDDHPWYTDDVKSARLMAAEQCIIHKIDFSYRFD